MGRPAKARRSHRAKAVGWACGARVNGPGPVQAHVPDRVSVRDLKPRGFETLQHVPKSSYKDCSTVIIVPSRDEFLHRRWVEMFQGLQHQMNGKRHTFFVTGAEVGLAYDELVTGILAHPELSKWKFVATIEDDVMVPPDALLKLYEAIDVGPFDGVSGAYFVKNGPIMAYGDPYEFSQSGVLDFKPIDVAEAMQQNGVIEVNGIACGISLYRMSLLRDVPGPRFETSSCATQDLHFCSKARRMGKRFAVDMRVRCAHMDWATGEAY